MLLNQQCVHFQISLAHHCALFVTYFFFPGLCEFLLALSKLVNGTLIDCHKSSWATDLKMMGICVPWNPSFYFDFKDFLLQTLNSLDDFANCSFWYSNDNQWGKDLLVSLETVKAKLQQPMKTDIFFGEIISSNHRLHFHSLMVEIQCVYFKYILTKHYAWHSLWILKNSQKNMLLNCLPIKTNHLAQLKILFTCCFEPPHNLKQR